MRSLTPLLSVDHSNVVGRNLSFWLSIEYNCEFEGGVLLQLAYKSNLVQPLTNLRVGHVEVWIYTCTKPFAMVMATFLVSIKQLAYSWLTKELKATLVTLKFSFCT